MKKDLNKVDLSGLSIKEYNQMHQWCTKMFVDYVWHHQPSKNKYWLELTNEQASMFYLRWS